MSRARKSFSDIPTDMRFGMEEIIARFEEAWQRGDKPTLEAFLPANETIHLYLLAELVHADLECRLKGGEEVRVEIYLQRFPGLGSDTKMIVGLIAAEYELRKRRDSNLTLDEFFRRFPDYRVELAAHLHFDSKLNIVETVKEPIAIIALPPDKTYPTIHGYEIQHILGRGGMGVVYKARQVHLKRLVALKMILSGAHAGLEDFARFRIEAESVARLQHPHIVQIYEVGTHDRLPYFSLEYVEGGSLDKKLDGTQPPHAAAQLIETLARAMHYAHQQGIVHRDLKPANILLSLTSKAQGPKSAAKSLGVPKITDFGLAKQLEDEAGRTVAGQVMGTPSYMAPEQAAGQTKAIGPSADIYALGAILYELVTGRPPFRGATVLDTLDQVRSQEPVPPSQLQPKLPLDLETICLKCLQKEPQKRYATAADLAEDLRRFQADEPIVARPVGRVERGWRWCRRNPAVAGLLTAVAASLLLGTVVASFFAVESRWNAQQSNENARQSQQNADLAEENAQKAKQKEADAIREADLAKKARTLANDQRYHSDMLLASQAWDNDRIDRVLQLLEGQRPERTDGEDRRDFEWYHLWQRYHAEVITIKGHTEVSSVAFSPNGKWLASASLDTTIKLWDTSTGLEIIALKGHTQRVTSVAFSPDGTLLASASLDTTIKVWDVASGREVLTFRGHTEPVHTVTFGPDSKRLATATVMTVKLWDATTGHEAITLTGQTDAVPGLAFSADGKRLASTNEFNTVTLWDTMTGQKVLTFKGHTQPVLSVVFGPDGKRLASASADHTVKVWDASTGLESFALKGHTAYVNSVAFSPDGKRLASASGDKTVKVWDMTTGQEVLTLKVHTDVRSVTFSPDGKQIISARSGPTVNVWDATADQECLSLKGHTQRVASLAFSADGKWLASASFDQTVKLWDATTGQGSHTLNGHPGEVFSVAFTPDGKPLASARRHKTIRVLNANTDQEVLTIKVPNQSVSSVVFSPDGKQLASAVSEDQTVKVWDTTTGREALTLKGHTYEFTSLAFSPDGKRLASTKEFYMVKVWDTTTGQEAITCMGHTDLVASVAFSPDGKWLATASADQTVKLWDATTGHEIHTLKGHTSYVTSVAFSPDGKRLASASGDKTVKIWDATTGQACLTLKGHTADVTSVAFSPDGKQLASASDDRTVRLWNADKRWDGPEGAQLQKERMARALQPDPDWNLRQADEARSQQQWFAMVFHLNQSARHQPLSPQLVLHRDEAVRILSASNLPVGNTPGKKRSFDQWLKQVAGMLPEEQVKAVAQKLQEYNPGFDGKVTHRIENGILIEFGFVTDNVTDILPVRALTGLQSLSCKGNTSKGQVSDLSPLKDMKLTYLDCRDANVSDLSPLKDMKLTFLDCTGTKVTDLSPLKGMKLTTLACGYTQVSNLMPLQGMPLTALLCGYTQVADLAPLHGMPLTICWCGGTKVSDLLPLRGMLLTGLRCDNTPVSDLTPLKGMPLTELICFDTKVSDLTPLQGMPLTTLFLHNSGVNDLSPLQGMNLSELDLTPRIITKGIEVVRQMKSLKAIDIAYPPKLTPDEFWKSYDAGEFSK